MKMKGTEPLSTEKRYSVQSVYTAMYGRVAEGESSTLADGMMVTSPPRLDEVVKAIKNTSGGVVLVSNSEIAKAYETLWKWGFMVELTSAIVYAAYEKIFRNMKEGSKILLILTGSGLKTLQ
jgi:threonine synthase